MDQTTRFPMMNDKYKGHKSHNRPLKSVALKLTSRLYENRLRIDALN